MGSAPDRLPGDHAGLAHANARAALCLLAALQRRGLEHLVLCPGSRSAPLAVAAALLEPRGLHLHTAIDERSAAFFALGLGRGRGRPAAVVTTSGTAVAQLLAAAVEADLGTIPLLLVSADRPQRLKNCGANQSVPQEGFLLAACRRLLQGPEDGMAEASPAWLDGLAGEAMAAACGSSGQQPPGPVHLNLPFEEPLHVNATDLEALTRTLEQSWAERPGQLPSPADTAAATAPPAPAGAGSGALPALTPACRLDPDRPGVVVAGPWRGTPEQWPLHCQALLRWQRRSGWPVLADALSGLRGLPDLELICAYDPLLQDADAIPAAAQVLRLGPLPASRRLQRWLESGGGHQVLVSQGDARRLDPLGTVATGGQWSGGLASWVTAVLGPHITSAAEASVPAPCRALARQWRLMESAAQRALEFSLPAPAEADAGTDRSDDAGGTRRDPAARTAAERQAPGGDELPLSEPWLARVLSRLLPTGLPLMLASSSPVRDWESFAGADAPWRPIHGFRGASGIDGTLSIACGLAEACGRLVLISGDLALLHDANGWLWAGRLQGQLTVLLIENGGGGIFEQLPIRTQPPERLDFERLFAMPQNVDQLALAALHGVPGRRVRRAAELPGDLAWALDQPFALLEVRTNRQDDARLRLHLRQAVCDAAGSAGRMADLDRARP